MHENQVKENRPQRKTNKSGIYRIGIFGHILHCKSLVYKYLQNVAKYGADVCNNQLVLLVAVSPHRVTGHFWPLF